MFTLNIPYCRLYPLPYCCEVETRHFYHLPTQDGSTFLRCNNQSVCSSISPTQMKISLSSPFLHVSNRWHLWSLLCYFGTTRPQSKQSQTNCHTNVQTPAEGELHLETPGGGVGTHLRASSCQGLATRHFPCKAISELKIHVFSFSSKIIYSNTIYFFLYLNLQQQIICSPHTLHPCKAGMSENKQKQHISGIALLRTARAAHSISDTTTTGEK